MIHWSKKILAKWVGVAFGDGIARVSFEYQSVTTTTYWFLLAVFGGRPKMFMATISRVSVGGQRWSRRRCQYRFWLRAQPLHCSTVLSKLFAIWNHKHLRRSMSYIWYCPECPPNEGSVPKLVNSDKRVAGLIFMLRCHLLIVGRANLNCQGEIRCQGASFVTSSYGSMRLLLVRV